MIAPARLAVAALALVAAAPAEPGDGAGAYRMRIAIVAGAGSAVQRLALPPAALAASRTPGLADIRVFDAHGQAMPIARVAAAAETRRDLLPAMPILGAADALKVSGVSLQVDGDGSARIARVDGTLADGGRSVVLGALLDARGVSGAARSLTLDADMPAGQPVSFVVEASRDLAAWRTIGSAVAYRRAGAVARAAIPLGMAALSGDYLRVTWQLSSRPLSPVVVRRALLASRPATSALAWVDAILPAQKGGRTIDFALPFATPVAALAIRPLTGDLLVPVRVLGRNDAEQAWTLLGQGVATRATGTIPLGGGAFRLLRIEADARTPGFTAAPALRIGFAPADLLFLAAGTGPFTLAAGREGDTGRYLPAASLMAEAGGLPPAAARAAATPARVSLLAAGDSQRGRRQIMLWGVLLAATALLAALAWRLARRAPVGPPTGD